MKEITIGRLSDNSVAFPQDHTVSGHHAKIVMNAGQYYIQDLGSTNGTFVNGQRITGARQLNMQDVVRVGNQTLPWLRYFDGSIPVKPATPKPGPQPPIVVQPSSQNNGLAIAGFVCSFFPGICIAGLVMSIIGLSKAKEMNGNGKGLAIAGIVISSLWLLPFLFTF